MFPYDNEEEFKSNRFYKSIEEVNIGAIPFLPSTTKLMEDFLDEIIEESSYSSFERAIEPVGKDDYLKDEYFKQRTKSESPNFIFGLSNFHTVQSMILCESLTQRTNVSRASLNREVLVGALKSKEQLEVNLKHNFYHIPAKKINLAKNNIKYVALSQSQNLFGSDGGIVWYGEIKDIHLVKRNEILELPKDDDSMYYRLEIEKWCNLEKKIKIDKYQVRSFIYTTFYLLKNAGSVTELCIKTKEEFRLFLELKRLYNEILIEGHNMIDVKSKIIAFNIDDVKIIVDDQNIISISGAVVIKVSKEEFLKRPIKVIKELLVRTKIGLTGFLN